MNVMKLMLAVAAVAALCGCRGEGSATVAAQTVAKPVAVQTTHPEKRDVPRLIALPGECVPVEEATLYAKVPGYLSRIAVDKGDSVRTGQVLAEISAPELTADTAQAAQSYRSAIEAAQAGAAAGKKSAAEIQRARAALAKAQADEAQAPVSIERARALQAQAEAGVSHAEALRAEAEAAHGEALAQVERARADAMAAGADERLAMVTYQRLSGVYQRDSKLVAKQQVDEAESRAQAAQNKTEAAKAQAEAAQRKVHSAETAIEAADRQISAQKAAAEAARLQVRLAETQHLSAARQVEMARRDVEVARQSGGIAEAQARQARFAASAQQSAAGRSSTLAGYARIVAPFAGTVTKRFVDQGAFVQTASASQSAQPVVTVANLDTLRIYLHVPESEARLVRPGTPVTLASPALPDEEIKAKVARITGALDPKTRTMLAEVDLPNPGRRLLPGAYVVAKVALENHAGVISLPSAAVGSEKSGKFLFIVDGGKAKRIPVTTGFDDGSRTEITEGLKGSEEVVVTNRDALSPGTPLTTSAWVPIKKKK